jgi:DNA-binding Lrp family transcriptional regulator
MDAKDKQILLHLLDNARMSHSDLAKKVRLSREVTMYRVRRLEEQGIIKQYYTEINYSLLGYGRYLTFIQLKGISAKQEQKLMCDIAALPQVSYLGPTIGRWNIVFDIFAKTQNQVGQVMEQIGLLCGSFLDTYIINGSGGQEEVFPTKYLGSKRTLHHEPKGDVPKIDDTDIQILELLAYDARIDYVALHKKISLSANAIKNRIKKMYGSYILGYTITLDINKLDLTFYNIQVKLQGAAQNKIISYLRENKHVVFYYRYLGYENWDLDIGVIVRSSNDLRLFLLELKELFGEYLKLHDMYMIPDIIKDNIPAQVLFN